MGEIFGIIIFLLFFLVPGIIKYFSEKKREEQQRQMRERQREQRPQQAPERREPARQRPADEEVDPFELIRRRIEEAQQRREGQGRQAPPPPPRPSTPPPPPRVEPRPQPMPQRAEPRRPQPVPQAPRPAQRSAPQPRPAAARRDSMEPNPVLSVAENRVHDAFHVEAVRPTISTLESIGAARIAEAKRKRLEKQRNRLRKLDSLPPLQRAIVMAEILGRPKASQHGDRLDDF